MSPRRSMIIGLCSVLVGLGQVSSASTVFHAQPEVYTSAGISYMSGGIGEEERDTLALVKK